MSVAETNTVHHAAVHRLTRSHLLLMVKTIKQHDSLKQLFSEQRLSTVIHFMDREYCLDKGDRTNTFYFYNLPIYKNTVIACTCSCTGKQHFVFVSS